MDLDHRLLVLLVVVGSNRPRGADQLDDVRELAHFGPVSSVEAVAVSQVDVCPMSQEKFNDFLVAEPSSVVQGGEASLVPDGGIGSTVEQQGSDFVVILLDGVVQWRFFPNVMVLLARPMRTLRLTSAPYLSSSLTKLLFWMMTAMWRGEAPLTFWALTWAYRSG